MATTQQLLDDILLRYRHTFTVSQILVWFNEEQRELFDILELDSPPYTFQTVLDEQFYPFPSGLDYTKIKTVTYEDSSTEEPNFIELPFLRNDDEQYSLQGPWYTIVSDSFFLYIPDSVPDSRSIYIYLDSTPDEATTANLSSEPSLPVRYQEILKLGTLKRIAGARKDIVMRDNYDAEYQEKITDVMWLNRLKEPNWTSVTDESYRAGNRLGYGSFRWGLPYWSN